MRPIEKLKSLSEQINEVQKQRTVTKGDIEVKVRSYYSDAHSRNITVTDITVAEERCLSIFNFKDLVALKDALNEMLS